MEALISFFENISSPYRASLLMDGIDTHMKAEENDRLRNLLAIPFQKHRKPITDHREKA